MEIPSWLFFSFWAVISFTFLHVGFDALDKTHLSKSVSPMVMSLFKHSLAISSCLSSSYALMFRAIPRYDIHSRRYMLVYVIFSIVFARTIDGIVLREILTFFLSWLLYISLNSKLFFAEIFHIPAIFVSSLWIVFTRIMIFVLRITSCMLIISSVYLMYADPLTFIFGLIITVLISSVLWGLGILFVHVFSFLLSLSFTLFSLLLSLSFDIMCALGLLLLFSFLLYLTFPVIFPLLLSLRFYIICSLGLLFFPIFSLLLSLCFHIICELVLLYFHVFSSLLSLSFPIFSSLLSLCFYIVCTLVVLAFLVLALHFTTSNELRAGMVILMALEMSLFFMSGEISTSTSTITSFFSPVVVVLVAHSISGFWLVFESGDPLPADGSFEKLLHVALKVMKEKVRVGMLVKLGVGLLGTILFQNFFIVTSFDQVVAFLYLAVMWLANLTLLGVGGDFGVFNFLLFNMVVGCMVSEFALHRDTWLAYVASLFLFGLRLLLHSLTLRYGSGQRIQLTLFHHHPTIYE